MAEKQENKFFSKYFDPKWLNARILFYRGIYGSKVMVFLFFVLISSVIWFFSALGKEYLTSITFPVRYTNFPSDKVLVNDLPQKLDLKVESVGSTILSYKLKIGIRPVTFDVNSFLKSEKSDPAEFFILTSTTEDEIQNQLPPNIRVVDIEPDTIFFRLADVVSKKVIVSPDINVNFEQQFMQKGKQVILPDSIKITGPQVIIDTIEFVSTQRKILRNIKDTVRTELKLMEIPGISFSEKEVELIINAEKYTEAELTVPVQVDFLPDSLVIKLFPKTVTVTYKVGLSDFGEIYPSMFKIALDYREAIQNLNRKVNVSLVDYPDYVSNINYFPKTVEFVIEK